MSSEDDTIESTVSKFIPLIKRSPGLILVVLGFVTVYLVVIYRGRSEAASFVDYFAFGFAFLMAVSGIILLFIELRGSSLGDVPIETPATAGDLEHAVTQLGRNYDVLRRQATQGFVLAGTFMALGICVILAGSVGELFGLTKHGSNLTTVAGVVVEVVSGLGLYLFKQTFSRLNVTSDRLHETWKILTAFKKAESLPEEQKTQVIATLITKLVEPARSRSGD